MGPTRSALLAVCLLAHAASADPAEDAYQEGLRLYDLREWEAAIAKFKETYKLRSDPASLFNKLPELPNEIASFAKRRNPMNHMSVVFRKEAVLLAGNYIPFQGYEDYYLWIALAARPQRLHRFREAFCRARARKPR